VLKNYSYTVLTCRHLLKVLPVSVLHKDLCRTTLFKVNFVPLAVISSVHGCKLRSASDPVKGKTCDSATGHARRASGL